MFPKMKKARTTETACWEPVVSDPGSSVGGNDVVELQRHTGGQRAGAGEGHDTEVPYVCERKED